MVALLFKALAVISLLVIATFAFQTLGPRVESAWLPVLDAKLTLDPEENGYIPFMISGGKLRDCLLADYGLYWTFDHSIMAAGFKDEAGNVGQIPTGIRAGQQFILGPYYVLVPAVARLRPSVTLVLTLYYDCHSRWKTEQTLMAVWRDIPPVVRP